MKFVYNEEKNEEMRRMLMMQPTVEEGKALLEKWGLPEKYRGVGICVLGYAGGPAPKAKPRKEDYIIRP